jgi:hypothetical protein
MGWRVVVRSIWVNIGKGGAHNRWINEWRLKNGRGEGMNTTEKLNLSLEWQGKAG